MFWIMLEPSTSIAGLPTPPWGRKTVTSSSGTRKLKGVAVTCTGSGSPFWSLTMGSNLPPCCEQGFLRSFLLSKCLAHTLTKSLSAPTTWFRSIRHWPLCSGSPCCSSGCLDRLLSWLFAVLHDYSQPEGPAPLSAPSASFNSSWRNSRQIPHFLKTILVPSAGHQTPLRIHFSRSRSSLSPQGVCQGSEVIWLTFLPSFPGTFSQGLGSHWVLDEEKFSSRTTKHYWSTVLVSPRNFLQITLMSVAFSNS